MTRAYPLTSNVPQPEKRERLSFNVAELPLKTMNVGESFLIPEADLPRHAGGSAATTTAGARVHVAAKRAKIKVRVEKRIQDRDNESGLRVWRIA